MRYAGVRERARARGSYPRLLAGRVCFGIAKNEPDVFAELDGRLVLSFSQIVENRAKVHR